MRYTQHIFSKLYFHLIGYHMFYALAFGTGVVIAISFQQVNAAPYAERASECDNESLKSIDCRIEKIHIYTFLSYCCLKKLFFLLTVIMNFRFCTNWWSVILKSCLTSPHFFIKKSAQSAVSVISYASYVSFAFVFNLVERNFSISKLLRGS